MMYNIRLRFSASARQACRRSVELWQDKVEFLVIL